MDSGTTMKDTLNIRVFQAWEEGIRSTLYRSFKRTEWEGHHIHLIHEWIDNPWVIHVSDVWL